MDVKELGMAIVRPILQILSVRKPVWKALSLA
jgi:hypothetical protein